MALLLRNILPPRASSTGQGSQNHVLSCSRANFGEHCDWCLYNGQQGCTKHQDCVVPRPSQKYSHMVLVPL